MAVPAPRLIRSDSWLDSVLESFSDHLLNQEFSPQTVRSYSGATKSFFAYLREQGVDDMHRVERGHIEGWQTYLRSRVPPLKASSRSLYSTGVRMLIRYAAECDIVDPRLERAVVGVRTRGRQTDDEVQPIPEQDLQRLMLYLAPPRPRMTIIDWRDRALFFFIFETCLRVNEVLQVSRADYRAGRVRQKGGKFVDFFIGETVAGFVDDYLRERRDQLPWLWVKHGNNARSSDQVLADSGVREIWRRLCWVLRIDRFTTHQLRHTGATVAHEGGVDQLGIANWLHHADLRQVQRYAKVRERSREKTLDVFETFIKTGIRPPMGFPKSGRRGFNGR